MGQVNAWLKFIGALARLELRLSELGVAIDGQPHKSWDARRANGNGY